MKNGMLISVLVGLLFALPAQAQTAPYMQSGSINPWALNPASAGCVESAVSYNWAFQPSYTCTLAKPLTSPCTIVVSVRYPLQGVIADSQHNTFALASGNSGKYDQLWYSTTCSSGTDAITVMGTQQSAIVVYSGVWVADQFSDDTNATGLSSYTALITPTQSGELIIGFGSNHQTNTPQITAGTGFTLRANANEFIEDLLQATAAPIFASVTYPASLTWCQSTVSFKLGTPPGPFVLKLAGLTNLTFLLSDPAQLPVCKPSEGVCSLSVAICFTDSGQCAMGVKGSVSVVKTTNSSTTSTQVIQASP